MLRETLITEDEIDLDNVLLSHYRLSEIRRQDLKLMEDSPDYKLEPGDGPGTAKGKNKKEELISQIINRLNELFITDQLTEVDLVNYAQTITDKVAENDNVMMQIANNTPEQALLGDFTKAVEDAIMDSDTAHQNQKIQLLSDPVKAEKFARVVFDLLRIVA